MSAYPSRKRKASYKATGKRTKIMNARQGRRDYRVNAPKSVGFTSSGRTQASYMSDPDGSVYVTHKEYIMDVVKGPTVGGAYANIPTVSGLGLRLNPGSEVAFPWTSGLARNFEKYQFVDVKYTYKPLAGTDEPGTVMMAIDYKPSDDAPADKGKMLLLTNASRASVWTSTTLRCDPSNLQANNAELIASDADVPSRTTAIAELTQTDVGNLFLAVQGMGDGNITCGEIWCEYTVRMYNPKEPGLLWGDMPAMLELRNGFALFHGAVNSSSTPFNMGGGGYVITAPDFPITYTDSYLIFPPYHAYWAVEVRIKCTDAVASFIPNVQWRPDASSVSIANHYPYVNFDDMSTVNNIHSGSTLNVCVFNLQIEAGGSFGYGLDCTGFKYYTTAGATFGPIQEINFLITPMKLYPIAPDP